MRILTRYIAFDLLKVFLLTLTVMTAFLFVILAGKLAVEESLGLMPILRALPYILPQAMQFAVPGAMLLSTVTVYGRIAASNEIVAVKSMGISPMILVWPTLILATLVSLGGVVLNDVAVSWGRGGQQRVLLESLEEIVYGRLRTTRSYSDQRFKVTVRRVEGRRLIQPTVLIYNAAEEKPATIIADEAEFNNDPENNAIKVAFINADVDMHGQGSIHHPGLFVHAIDLNDLVGTKASKRRPSEYALSEIGPSKVEQTSLIDRLQQEMTAEMGHALMTGRTYQLAEEKWRENQIALDIAVSKMHRLRTEPHRRWANGFSCLCFVMIGAPMAIRLRHGEIWGSFFACFLPILLVYYPMLAGCLDLAKDGVLPPQAVWLGNLVLALWGMWLVRRVVKF
ncbi:MAG: LptF/LptG family permease [Planctomycetota bacterium]